MIWYIKIINCPIESCILRTAGRNPIEVLKGTIYNQPHRDQQDTFAPQDIKVPIYCIVSLNHRILPISILAWNLLTGDI